MGQIFRVILSLSVSGGLVGLLILLFRPMTRRFFAKRWTYYLWLLLLVRLLVPIHADINLMGQVSTMLAEIGGWQVSADETSEAEPVEDMETKKQTGNVPGMESAGNADETFDAAVTEDVDVNATAAGMSVDRQGTKQRTDIFKIAGIFWILGLFLTAVYRVCTYKNFVKEINAGCIPVTDWSLLNKNAEIRTRLGIVKEVLLYENAAVNTPMLIGLRRPYIVLPSQLTADMAGRENDIRLILHHELIHYKRRDLWYKWLFQAVLCVHWFNPFLYLFNRKFNVDCELSCDEAVMALLSEEGRRIYGNVLLDVAEKNLSGETFVMRRNVPTMTLLEEKSMLKERLQEIAKYQKKRLVIGFCSALVLMVFIVAAVVCGVAGVHAGSGNVSVAHNDSMGLVDFMESLADVSFLGPIQVSKTGKPYRMYDDDELIAGESDHDTWQARNYCGGEKSVEIDKFVLNGSDALWILYANKETTLEMSSTFHLCEGRFKLVWVKPDQSVQTLNESGENNSVNITLAQGRNVFKIVGQKAQVEDINISYEEMTEEDFDGIYCNENQEYAYQVLEGKKSVDVSRLEEASIYLDAKEVSELYRCVWESGIALSDENWENLFIYSDKELTSRYLLEALQDRKITGFDSRILAENAPYMSGEDLVNIVLALGKDALTFNDLDDVIPFLGEEQAKQCIFYYIDMGNVLTDSQLGDVEPFVSEKDFYRIIEYNGKKHTN